MLFIVLSFSISIVSVSYGEVNPTYELSTTKGVQRLNAGDYDSSGTHFEEALKAVPGDIKATLFLGIVRSRQERYNEAEGLLVKVLESGKELPRVHYELGLISYYRGDNEKAKEHLKVAKELSTDINLNMSIDSLLAAIEFRPSEKRFSLTAIIGAQYDTNVAYIPESIVVEKAEKSDYRGVFYGKAEWIPISTNIKTTLGYSFYQSIHESLSEFNTQIHELSAIGNLGLSRKASLKGKYSFEYTFLGGDRYSRIHLASPSILFEWKKRLSTRLYYEFRSKTFWDTEVSTDSENRDADNHLIGFEQLIPLGKYTRFNILYSYDRNSANADYWTYDGNQIAGSLNYTDPKWRIDLKAEYYDKQFKGEYPLSITTRHDKTETYTASLARSLSRKLSINLGQVFIRNRSNIGFYDYNRAISSLFLMAMF